MLYELALGEHPLEDYPVDEMLHYRMEDVPELPDDYPEGRGVCVCI